MNLDKIYYFNKQNLRKITIISMTYDIIAQLHAQVLALRTTLSHSFDN